jgi:branched-chain amino acid transport system ATP-binding protein
MSSALLEVKDLCAGYGEIAVLRGLSLHVERNETVAVIGGNGAGKTTLIRAIAGMLRASSGTVTFLGQQLTNRPAYVVCELGLAQVPESRQIFPTLSVEDNLRLGAILRRARARSKANIERVYAMFPRLAERRRQLAGTLSGGEQQMLAIARAIMADPVMMMLDEPSLGLAPLMVETMFDIISSLRAQSISMLLVEQNVIESLSIADRGYILENGEIALSGPASALAADARVREAYLGV